MTASSPFEKIGGVHAVAALADAFYDRIETDGAFAELRRMHAADLSPMRASLTGFLTGWLGGPRDWFEQNPGKCMMSLHAGIAITRQTAEQWVDAMIGALRDQDIEPAFAEALGDAFRRMALAMVRGAA